MKKLLALALAVVLTLACASCAFADGETRVGTKLFPCDEKGYPNLGGATIDIWSTTDSSMVDFIDSYADLKIIQNLMSFFNVNLTFRHAPVGEESENFTLMIASTDLPDIIWGGAVNSYYPGKTAMAYEDGLAYDYTEYITRENTPNYFAYVMDDPYLAKLAVDDSGRNVKLGSRVSGSEDSCTCMWGMMIRSDYLAKTGLDLPETIDDWTEMLRAFKQLGIQYPMLLNKSGYWKSRNAFSCAWNIDARNFFLTEDGEVAYGPATEEYKEYISQMHDWYAEGLINPDFQTDTQSDTWSMIANDQAGCVVDHTYAYASKYYRVVEEQNPEKALIAAQMPKLNAEDELTHVMVTNRGIENDQTITTTSDVKLESIALLDALYIEEIEFMMANGIEGEGYNLNDFGYPVITDVESNPDATDDAKRGMRLYAWETESDGDLEYITTSKYCYGVQPQTVRLYTQCGYDRIYPAVSFTAEEAEVQSEYLTDIQTYRDEMMAKFIVGEADIDAEWDKYIETLRTNGLDELQEVYAAAYARFAAR